LKLCKEDYIDLYEVLKSSRIVKGEFTFKGWETNDNSDDYEELFYSVCEILRSEIGDNYWNWYDKIVNRYIRYKENTNKNTSVYIPQKRFINEEHNVRQQLAVLKFYVYRKTNSQYLGE
jgi:hypothetical protein